MGQYKSGVKLARDRAFSEFNMDATLLAKAQANLGLTGNSNLDGTFVLMNTGDNTKEIKFSAAGETTGKVATIAVANANNATYTLPAATDTIVGRASTDTLTNKTLTAPVINGATSASGNFDLSGSTGTFKTSTGVNTIGGTVSVSANKNIACVAGTTAVDYSLGTGVFKTTTGANTIGGPATFPAGTATAGTAPIYLTSGTNLTVAAAGAIEYDGVMTCVTNDTTSGRAIIPAKQYFFLNASGTGISTVANFFGTTSNISLVSGGYYDIDIFLWYTNSADTNTATFTLLNSSAPTLQNIYFEMSPAAGVVAPPGTATALVGQFIGDNTASKAFNTAALGSAASYYSRFKIWLKNGTGTSLKIQCTKNTAGTITPLAGSYWQATRLTTTNVGNFAA